MSDHLTPAMLNAFVDGELSGEQLASASEHLADCSQCTSSALVQSLLKSATARAGQRYAPPPELRERLVNLGRQEPLRPQPSSSESAVQQGRGFGSYAWAAAAVLLVCVGLFVVQRGRQRGAEYAGLVTEVSDQHIATLAANSPPEVISSDRHTVKPWFQGKIPFSFNLPQSLPGDTTLDGANLTYLRSQPAAQLLYSVGKHRVSVFVQEKTGAEGTDALLADHSGFHLRGFRTGDLEVVAVSDVDPGRLADLVAKIEDAQAGAHEQPK
jgi:anti-sigma factor RsiW